MSNFQKMLKQLNVPYKKKEYEVFGNVIHKSKDALVFLYSDIDYIVKYENKMI